MYNADKDVVKAEEIVTCDEVLAWWDSQLGGISDGDLVKFLS